LNKPKNAKKKITSQQQYRRRVYMRLYIRKRRRKALHHLQEAVYDLIKYQTKEKELVPFRWEKVLGYNVIQLYHHLTKQFYGDMKWSNYGSLWQIDHKECCASYNFTSYKDPEFKRLWRLENIQPLLTEHNKIKFTKTPKQWDKYKKKHNIITE